MGERAVYGGWGMWRSRKMFTEVTEGVQFASGSTHAPLWQYGFAPSDGCEQDHQLLRATVTAASAAGDEAVAAAAASSPKTPLAASVGAMQSLMAVSAASLKCRD